MRDVFRNTGVAVVDRVESVALAAADSPSPRIAVRLVTVRAAVAERLSRLLGGSGTFDVLGQSDKGPATVLLMDCARLVPHERPRLRRSVRGHLPARVLWLLDAAPADAASQRFVLDAVLGGWCHGYVLEDCPAETLLRAVAAVAGHDIWLPRALLTRAFSDAGDLPADAGTAGAAPQLGSRVRTLLTPRERQIFRLVRRGLTNKAVGQQLGVKEDTVKKHLRNMYAKLGVHRRAQMLAEARIGL